jgi:hypothetical protein
MDVSKSGQDGASSGEKWNVPGASADCAGLRRVVAAWPRLRPELKAAILAIAQLADDAELVDSRSRRDGPFPPIHFVIRTGEPLAGRLP